VAGVDGAEEVARETGPRPQAPAIVPWKDGAARLSKRGLILGRKDAPHTPGTVADGLPTRWMAGPAEGFGIVTERVY
jgi:hypothetical protein